MIESIVNAFTKNSFIFSRKGESDGGDFQQTLEKHDHQIQNQDRNDRAYEDPFEYRQEDEYKHDDYAPQSEAREDHEAHEAHEEYSHTEEAVENKEETVETESADKTKEEGGEETKTVSEEDKEQDSEEARKEMDIIALLKELGLSEESLKNIEKLAVGAGELPGEDALNKLLTELKASLSKEMPPALLKKVETFAEKLQQFLKDGSRQVSKEFKQLLENAGAKSKPAASVAKEAPSEFEVPDKVDKQIKHNNTKHAAMKEVAQDMKNVKFNSDIDPRYAQDTKKSNQAFQARQAQFHAMSGNASQKQQSGGAGQQQNGGEASLKSPNFMKKMKTILKSNAQNSQTADFSLNQQSKAQAANVKPAFMNRVANGQFMQQLVDRIQSMVKANTTLSASIDFKSAEFGEMKLAAEAQGTNLAVKLSNIASNLKADVVSLKGELDAELKNLGFENISLDFGTGSESNSGSNAFEQEMQKRLSGEHVKLPGDHLADLKAIDEWMRDFEKVM